MAGGWVGYCGGDSKISSAFLQNLKVPCASQQFDSPQFLPGSSPSFLGKRSIVSFANVNEGNRWDRSFFRSFDQEENLDDEWDEYFHQPEKKRRLAADQIQFLERSFEADNKLEPERKIQLAKELGLQPRQIAIWFQNRRARWKTKQLEKDYEALQASYDGLKANYDGLLKEKEKLKAQVLSLTDQLLLGQKEKESMGSSVNKEQYGAPLQEPIADSISQDEVSKVSITTYEPEDLCSRKIDELDSISDSSRNIDGGHSTLVELGDCSYVFEPDQSDLSQDEEDNFSKSLSYSLAYMFPKIEDNDCPDPPTSFFGFPVEDYTFGFWPY